MPLNGPRSLSNFTIGTFNVRGLSSATKRDQLNEDLNKLHIDVICIQETKCPSGFDVISGYYRLIGLPSGNDEKTSTLERLERFGYRRLCAKARRQRGTIEFLCIDLSRAFDTIRRNKLLWVLQ